MEKIHSDFAFEQLADILRVQMELLGQNGETDFLRKMFMEVSGNAGDRAFLLLLRLRLS